MGKPIALFAYDFPHRKTHDFIVDLLGCGVADIVVIAAPKKVLKQSATPVHLTPSLLASPYIETEVLCKNLELPFYRVEHDNVVRIESLQKQYGFETAIIAGARIIPLNVIDLFSFGMINFHPGKIPETSGLDAFLYTVKKQVPAGVTVHYIDARVDAGSLICFEQVHMSPLDTPESVNENVYQLQRALLQRLVPNIKKGKLVSSQIRRPNKNLPMSSEEKIKVLSEFETWRSLSYLRQQFAYLMVACEAGDVAVAEGVLDSDPSLVSFTNDKGWSPLIVASFHQQRDMVRFLLDHGADPNSSGLKGTTALMYAKTKLVNVSCARFSILDILIEAGADCEQTDCFGKTVLDYVKDKKDERLAVYFQNQRNKCDSV
tara:strand:+ start:211 stop:1335 length:1125 start_codon:yes stop_codon:yes gene_type:complete